LRACQSQGEKNIILPYFLKKIQFLTFLKMSKIDFFIFEWELKILYFLFSIFYFFILYFIFYILYFIFYILYFIFYILYFIFYIFKIFSIFYFLFSILYFLFYILYFIFYIFKIFFIFQIQIFQILKKNKKYFLSFKHFIFYYRNIFILWLT